MEKGDSGDSRERVDEEKAWICSVENLSVKKGHVNSWLSD